MHLVGFTIRNYHDAPSPERQIISLNVCHTVFYKRRQCRFYLTS